MDNHSYLESASFSILSGTQFKQMKRKTLLSWSSGKDSAWALHTLKQNPTIDLVGLFCTVNSEFNRVAMHAVRVELLKRQADALGLPLTIIEIPYPCDNEEYSRRMSIFVDEARNNSVDCFAFGDLYLQDIRQYREDKLKGSGIEPLFPLWGMPTPQLSKTMIDGGLKACITCIDPKQIPSEFAGRVYDHTFLDDLPGNVDPCGENGEFHSFVYDGPMFRKPVALNIGDTVQRDGFIFTDLIPA